MGKTGMVEYLNLLEDGPPRYWTAGRGHAEQGLVKSCSISDISAN